MKHLEEQRDCVKFYFKLGKTFTESFQMLQQPYGEDCLSRTQCHEWYQRLKSGRTSIEDDPKSGRPAEDVGFCKSSCHQILTDKPKMRRVAAKFVPRDAAP
jgi:hypothetical protein